VLSRSTRRPTTSAAVETEDTTMMNDGNSHAEGPLCTLRELESRHIARALELAGGNQRRAARVLGITRWALARRLRKLGLHSRPVATAPRNDRDNATLVCVPADAESRSAR